MRDSYTAGTGCRLSPIDILPGCTGSVLRPQVALHVCHSVLAGTAELPQSGRLGSRKRSGKHVCNLLHLPSPTHAMATTCPCQVTLVAARLSSGAMA